MRVGPVCWQPLLINSFTSTDGRCFLMLHLQAAAQEVDDLEHQIDTLRSGLGRVEQLREEVKTSCSEV